jgi:hypothetical protein
MGLTANVAVLKQVFGNSTHFAMLSREMLAVFEYET